MALRTSLCTSSVIGPVFTVFARVCYRITSSLDHLNIHSIDSMSNVDERSETWLACMYIVLMRKRGIREYVWECVNVYV